MKPLNPSTPMNDGPPPKTGKRSWPLWVLLGFMVVILAIGAIPGYFNGSWQWQSPPKVVALKELRQVRNNGLTLSGWETIEQMEIRLGGHRWSYQQLEGNWEKPVLLLLLIQNSDLDQPRVEWVDVNGFVQQIFRDWQTDSYQMKTWEVKTPSGEEVRVRSRFFRGWNPVQTFAVVQWYAWPTGGNPAPVNWFMADRLAQTRGDRAPWMAVSMMIPMEHLGDLEDVEDISQSLVQTIQTTLMETVFTQSPVQ
ncbi:cyanoexosortase B system-associated protein [Roseofilum sp. BLCC_M91]|uniref:Cyanoexosortase B system-associated protein n=1 Tax=Roseofilum halophilum BLCC-M91 TaxID=3022259 RepID=A0ABT7BEJ8_9CYAN|nr:cyanoexosortase B system-associated protein [Roseofilum halophilum]MDJ1177594.1 cyanoexosortase B system-associated protein [Roseofilum halophilum BLCC-M91]